MPEAASSNKRIAKNTLALYLRMFISMIVGLYTSRVVLATLGVEDYGTYGIVGGIVAMMGFLNSTMAAATSRFLAFEMGKGNPKRQNDTFCTALIVHAMLAFLVFIALETVGLWYLENKLNVPTGRLPAARWVYQLSIVSCVIGMTQTPYNASIITHEKMSVYAYMEILKVTLKLLIVYLLYIGNFDKLILYAGLTFGVSLLMMTIYRIYCIKKFKECHFHWIWDKSIMKPMLSFSGWNLFGNFGGIMCQQGTNFVINSFFGVVMNAAVSVGLTITSYVNAFSGNVMTAFRPQITKTFATNDIPAFQATTILAIKIILIIFALVGIPAFVESDYLLKLWLSNPPKHSGLFSRILLVNVYFETLRYILVMNMHASGNVKLTSLFTGSVFTLVPIASYCLFYIGFPTHYAFFVFICAQILLSSVNFFLVKHYIPQVKVGKYILAAIQVTVVSGIVLILMNLIHACFNEDIVRLFITTIISCFLLMSLAYMFCLDSSQRRFAVQFAKSKLHLI